MILLKQRHFPNNILDLGKVTIHNKQIEAIMEVLETILFYQHNDKKLPCEYTTRSSAGVRHLLLNINRFAQQKMADIILSLKISFLKFFITFINATKVYSKYILILGHVVFRV